MNPLSLATESGAIAPPEPPQRLTIGVDPASPAAATLAEIGRLPFVQSVLALPDLHQKEDMEVPSSLAITTRNVIVPEFTSVAVNDGMGIVATSLRARDMTAGRLTKFFSSVNANSAKHFFDANRYSLSAGELRDAASRGARAVLGKYGLDSSVLDRMEQKGFSGAAGSESELGMDAVPIQLLLTKFARCEMGLNFGGNHFLEVQVVDDVVDAETGRRWGLERDQVVVMYHLGPGPFSGTLLHHYSRRAKLYGRRVPLYFVSKLLFHYAQRLARGGAHRKWALHFRRNRWTALPDSSEEGLLFRRALALATNFGFAYRLATVRAIQDGWNESVSPEIGSSLLCDIPHNGISPERVAGNESWVARHNACRLQAGRLTIVAGSHDVPSYLGIGLDGSGGTYHSYDHGAGTLIEEQRRTGCLAASSGSVLRHVMTRGRAGRLVRREELPLRTTEPIDRLMVCLERARILRPVVRLRPLGTLKN